MNAEYFIAKRLYFSQQADKNVVKPAIKVALMGIAIGTAVMIITVCVVLGFKQQIVNQIVGFGGHIQVVNFDNNSTYESKPIFFTESQLTDLRAIEHVQEVMPFITKPCMLKTDHDFQAVIIKGIDLSQAQQSHKWNYFASHLRCGRLPQTDKEIIISQTIATRLQLSVDSAVLCYFINQDNIRVRKWSIVGVYQTGFEEFDSQFILGDITALRQLNGWAERQVAGVEISIDDFGNLQTVADEVFLEVGNQFDEANNGYYVQSLIDLNAQIFAWLDLLDMNVWVIIILMLCVSSFNIISALIILILNSINFIATLKALGATNRFLRKVFLIESVFLIGKGMLYGNLIGFVIAFLQYRLHLIPLDASVYYIDYVPIMFPWLGLLLLNVFIVLISVLVLWLPSFIVSHVSPAKVLRFE